MSSVCCGAGSLAFRQHDPGDGKAGRPGRHLTLSLDAHKLHSHILEPKSFLPTWPIKCVQTSDAHVAVSTEAREGLWAATGDPHHTRQCNPSSSVQSSTHCRLVDILLAV